MKEPMIILASSSPYRRELMSKLGLDFTSISPEVDESIKDNETPSDLVARLALEKAMAVAEQYPRSLIIGSDQVAVLEGNILTKPLSHEKAIEQLSLSSGKAVYFLTSLCLLNSASQKHQLQIIPYSVTFLTLTQEQIENYLQKEKPYNCAGSFKSEGLGITLFESMQGDDPNSLIGLPLIALTKMLRNEGIEPLL